MKYGLFIIFTWIVCSAFDAVVTWKDNSDTEDGFIVEYRAGTGPYREIGRVEKDVTIYGLRTDTPGTKDWCFRVRAYNKKGKSPPSNVDCKPVPIEARKAKEVK